jgi:phenylalanyl-tRNA synthetase beta chain
MKISYNWLKEHVDPGLSAKDLAGHLLSLGFEVSALERRGPGFTGVITAQILAIDKHPNADRLSLCKVTDGSRELSIVCGAKNIAVGQKIPLAVIGAKLPGGREITPAKIRGVESQGMICSASELGLAGENGGILVLDPHTDIGADFAKKLAGGDDILEVEITPNRPDCLSHLGLARELSAYFHIPLKERTAPTLAAPQGDCWPVELEAPQACPRYLGRVLTGLQIAPSPGWLAAKLEAVGLRSINNLVDITNFLLVDLGQPMHAFDLDKLEGGKVVVRFAKNGEKIKALDEKDYALTPEVLVIADAKKPAAIAGVMGGYESAVGLKTTKAFLESAHFAPPFIRKSGQILRLRSDSSYRFERGTDLAAVETASLRAAELIGQLCGKTVQGSKERNVGKSEAEKITITTTPERINAILGSQFPDDKIAETLEAVAPGGVAPSWRGDLETPADLAEEVARLLGYQNIPTEPARVPASPSHSTPAQTLATQLRRRLAGYGLCEAYNYDFISQKSIEKCGLDPQASPKLANPISEDWTILRPSLFPGLLQNAATNLNHGAAAVRLFEIGKVYGKSRDGLTERTHAAGLLLGPITDPFWQPARVWRADAFEALGLLQDLLARVPELRWSLRPGRRTAHACDQLFHTHAWQSVESSKGPLGAVGLLHPRAARAWDLERESAALFYLDLDTLCELEPSLKQFLPYSPFPTVKRDLSILVADKTEFSRVQAAAEESSKAQVQLIDLFTGKGVPPGQKSLTLRFTFSRDDRTLRDEEVNRAMEDVLAALQKQLGAVLRS